MAVTFKNKTELSVDDLESLQEKIEALGDLQKKIDKHKRTVLDPYNDLKKQVQLQLTANLRPEDADEESSAHYTVSVSPCSREKAIVDKAGLLKAMRKAVPDDDAFYSLVDVKLKSIDAALGSKESEKFLSVTQTGRRLVKVSKR